MSDPVERLRTALRDTYTLERQVGQGGMATVYLALDLKHDRRVAIKVLRPELTATLGTERFLREIQLAAKLQHPHIVPVYDSGAADGFLYYVMPFVDGESLRDLLQREGRVSIERAAEIVRDAASGLAYAHKQGVVHRDVKPENIMLSGGHAVVTDFGIARAIDASRAANAGLTGVGMAIGTPAYMSPEQATADVVDARSDQYALACVFYEMASGKQAFSAPTMQALLTQVLTGPRPRLATVVHTTPLGLDSAVQRALAQDPAQRFPDITAFANAVTLESSGTAAAARESRRWKRLAIVLPAVVAVAAIIWVIAARSTRVVVSGAETIAVVPFTATGTGVENLGEGMVDLIVGNLDGVGGIHMVESRQVIRAWQRRARNGTPTLDDAIAVARSVKAASVLMGSVVATGKTSRLTAELYDLDGKELARAQVDGRTDSVLTLADGLALKILREIWRSREPLPSARTSAITSGSMEAIRAYLDGEKWYRRGQWDSAQASYEQAVHADSTFAIAWYKLSTTLGWEQQPGTQTLAHTAAANAVKYSASLPTHLRSILVAYEMFQRGRPEAVDSMRNYTAQHPEDADAWYLLGEAQYHSRNYHPLPPADLIAPFDRVIAIDSTLAAAAIHPMEIALEERDSVLAKRYLKVFQDAHAVDEAHGASEAMAVQRGADTGLAALMTPSTAGMRMAALTGMSRSPTVTGTQLDGLLRHVVPLMPAQIRAQGWLAVGSLDGAMGRQQVARQIGDSLATLAGAAGFREYVTIMPVIGGFADSALLARFSVRLDSVAAANPASGPVIAYYRAMIALDQGQSAKAGSILQSAFAQLNATTPDFVRGGLIGLDGVRMMADGDAVRGAARADSGMRIVGGFGNPVFGGAVSLRLALHLASQPATRAAGIQRLRSGFTDRVEFLPIVQYDLAKAYEAAGDRTSAIASYGQFLRLWDHADSNFQSRVRDAKDAMQRLTAEGAK